jgi:hypothetical protein
MAATPPSSLTRLFDARAIALVGASEKGLWTKLMVDNHRAFGFESRLHLVNPRSAAIRP